MRVLRYNKHAARRHNAIYINLHALSFLVLVLLLLLLSLLRYLFHRASKFEAFQFQIQKSFSSRARAYMCTWARARVTIKNEATTNKSCVAVAAAGRYAKGAEFYWRISSYPRYLEQGS